MENNKDFYHNNDLVGKKYQISYWAAPKNFYKHNKVDYPHTFTGVVENFNPSGNCVFWNEDRKEMLVVDYNYISVMRAKK